MKLVTLSSNDDLNTLNYKALVEVWDNTIEFNSGSLSFKRKLKINFTPDEILEIRKYYKIFRKWYLITGTPVEYEMTIGEYQFLHKVMENTE